MIDRLEARRLFSTQVSAIFSTSGLSVTGTDANDDIVITYNPSDRLLRVYDHGVLRSTGLADTLKSIVVDCGHWDGPIGSDRDRVTIDASVPAKLGCDITTGFGDDTISGSNGDDRLVSQGGYDLISGNGGSDGLRANAGILHGGDGNDTLTGGASAELFGDAGVDTVAFTGVDAAYVNLGDELANDGPVGSHNFAHADIENIIGGWGNDYLVGSSLANSIRGGGGDDTIYGFDGDDTLLGEDGNDSLVGNANKDFLYGGIGNDILRGYGGKDMLFGEDGIDKLYGGDANDTLDGGSSNDRLQGDAGDDVMYGKKGDDHFYAKGDGGIDRLYGSDGSDDARIDLNDLLDHIEIVG